MGGSLAARWPSGPAARRPGGQAARRPGGQEARRPGGQAARRPGGKRERERDKGQQLALLAQPYTPNLRTNIMDFRGFDSSMIIILRGGILMPIGDFLEDLSQAILVGIMLVGRLGVVSLCHSLRRGPARAQMSFTPAASLRGALLMYNAIHTYIIHILYIYYTYIIHILYICCTYAYIKHLQTRY